MDKNIKLFWTPRILAILYILFLSLFALDAFTGEGPFYRELLGFVFHLLPSFILLITLAASWKYPVHSGIAFIFFSLLFTLSFNTYENILTLLIISLPITLIGILLIISHIKRSKHPI
ncbi:DUF7670 domain-containing protein [Pelotomaculum propionicicum]|uniref:DUF7670 domain-containing protein n=1 Tax=Pelotomaculum propionicicum TaxID=258475 RepID=UPI003B80A819